MFNTLLGENLCTGPRGGSTSTPSVKGLSSEAEEVARRGRLEAEIAAAKSVAETRANQRFILHAAGYRDGEAPFTLSLAEAGDPEGIPVFMFYGVGASRYFCLQFDKEGKEHGLRFISPDRPGFGTSQAWPERNMSDFADLIHSLCQEMKIDQFGIWGHSSGGAHAMAVCRIDPYRSICPYISV